MGERAADLPIPYARRLEILPERVVYVARPGIAALPSGTGLFCAFAGLQLWTLSVLLWAVWWPAPRDVRSYAFAVGGTTLIGTLTLAVVWLLLRRYPGFVLGVMRAPFIRLTVTDRRVLWTLPWERAPLMEIDRRRIMGGILGSVDAKGHGSAAMVLIPGDPSADIDGNIHFDRLPYAEKFVDALSRL